MEFGIPTNPNQLIPNSIFFWGREGSTTPPKTHAYSARERPPVSPYKSVFRVPHIQTPGSVAEQTSSSGASDSMLTACFMSSTVRY